MNEIENGDQPVDAASALRWFLLGVGANGRAFRARGCQVMSIRYRPLLLAEV
jgi:hypothetical protein